MRRQTAFKTLGIVATPFFVLILMTLMSACGPGPTPTPSVTPPFTPSATPSPPPLVPTPPAIETHADDEFGINWVNSPYTNPPHPISSQDRTDKAQQTGATWDRWPVYWYWVNQPVRWGEGGENFRWEGDYPLTGGAFNIGRAAGADGDQLETLAILDGIPRYYDCAYSTPYSEDHPYGSGCYGTTDDRIEGLSLDAAAGSPINEANRWAAYVYETVAHLSQHGTNHFEIWNEANLGENYKEGEETGGRWNVMNDPNPSLQWCDEQPACSYVDDYGNMVTSTIIAAQRANPNAQLILGAPTSSDEIFVPGNPTAGEAGRWVGNAWRYVADRGFDAGLNGIGIHSYGWSIFTPIIAEQAWDLIDSPLWVTESGLAVGTCITDQICANDEMQVADYLLQQYAYARAIDTEVIIHHRLQDDDDEGHFGLHSNAGERASAKAAQIATRYLQGAEFQADESKHPKFDKAEYLDFTSPFVKLVFKQPDAKVTVLWAHEPEPVEAGEIKIEAWGSNLSLINAQDEVVYHQCGVKPGDSIAIPQELEGAPGSVQTPQGWPAIGGPTYILVETDEPCKVTPPEGEASVICENGRAVGTDLQGYDADSGLASLSYACSPEKTYDLSWTEPGRTYAGPVYIAPPKDGACTLTLTDERASEPASERIGESASGRIGESAVSRSAVLLYRHVILVYADGEPGRPLFIVHLVIVNCPPPPAYASA